MRVNFIRAFIEYFPLIIFFSSLILMFIILSTERIKRLNNRRSTRLITFGIMASLSTIFQVSPVFLPGVGLMLSPFSSLPIAVGVILFPKNAFLLYLSTTIVTSFFSLQESLIFMFTTGPLGLGTSLLIIQNKIKWSRIWIPIFSLSAGINVLIHVIGLEGMVDIKFNSIMYIELMIILFSTVYTLIWLYILVTIKKRLNI